VEVVITLHVAGKVNHLRDGLLRWQPPLRFRRVGVDAAVTTLVLTLGGIFSTVAFAAMMVLAAVVSGDLAAAGGSLAGAALMVGVVATAVMRMILADGAARGVPSWTGRRWAGPMGRLPGVRQGGPVALAAARPGHGQP
jgi:hypothetical protein